MNPTHLSKEIPIQRHSPIPLYFQVETILQNQILNGVFAAGDQIPTEQELCEQFQVSRSVIRPALHNLVQHGLIERIPGKGTFVSKDKIQESLIKELLGFHEDTLLRGHKPSTKILHQQYLPATQEIAAKLGLSPGDPVFYLKRLRYVDGEPHLVSQTYLRAEKLPGIIDVDFNQDSLYEALANIYGVKIQHGKRVVEAILATEEDSQLLGIQAGAAILLLTSLVFQENGQPIEFSVGKHRADRTKFEVDLIRTKDELNLSSEVNRTQHVP